MAANARVNSIMRDPLLVHAELKRRGSNFSVIARTVSTRSRVISPQHVRMVVYGISSTHRELVLREVEAVLRQGRAEQRG